MAGSIVVLYVDGDPDFADRTAGALAEAGDRFDVHTVGDADAARERLASDDVDCVVSEFALSPDDGLALLEWVRESDPDLPFVLFTGTGSEQVASEAFGKGATDYVLKGADDRFERLAGSVRRHVATARERTRRKRRERELEQYETVVEAMGHGVYALDADGTLLEANENLARMLGHDRESLRGVGAESVIGEDTIEQFEDAIDHLRGSEERSVATVESPIQGKSGEAVPVEVTVTPLPSEDGEFRGAVGVVRDVTERRERERERERYETLVEVIPDTVVLTDLDGTIQDVYGNHGWSGYDYDELVGSHFAKTMPDVHVPRVETLVADLVRSDERSKATYETVMETSDGEQRFYENHITLLPPDDGQVPGTLSVLRDVSARVEHERELQRQNERLEEFAGIVSHDLRNPLNVATARLQLAIEECDSEHLPAVERAHDRMGRLIDDLLALARDGNAHEDERDVDLATVGAAAWRTVGTDAATLRVDTDLAVHAREGQLRQLLENLLANAVEHGGEDVTVWLGPVGDGRGFYVADDGPGIPAEERERVFESGHTTAEDGTGYGLSIVEGVAANHGWQVDVTESESGGARFEITWDGE